MGPTPFSRSIDITKPLNRPTSSVRDADIQAILEELTGQKKLTGKNKLEVIVTPEKYRYCIAGQEKERWYDKEYNVDGLAVFVEAELGIEINHGHNAEEFGFVTRFGQEMYERRFRDSQKGLAQRMLHPPKKETKKSRERDAYLRQVLNYVEAPLVPEATDAHKLEAIQVMSVRAEYEGLNIAKFDAPDWKRFIDAIAKKYGVEIYPAIVQSFSLNIESKSPFLVFNKTIVSTNNVEEYRAGITAVYQAGSTLKRALDERTQELVKRYLQ